MPLQLRDARSDTLRPFAPLTGSGSREGVGLYVCGITPYDSGHLGHAFTYVQFDVLNRYLRFLGHRVTYVQNLTDVDDDMLRKAHELGEDYLELGGRFTERFLSEMAELNWLPPDVYPRATEHIEPMQQLIATLMERGHAYAPRGAGEGHVYYDVTSFPRYGTLSRTPPDQMLPIANERGNVPGMPGKRQPLDFVLWQPSASDEPAWPSPWGTGRPGWHLECSAMSMAYLGERFELHGGGVDLLFPHHESEVAQSEAATGEEPFVDFWLHTGMVHHEGEKMSKSLGNLVLVGDLMRTYQPEAIRHYLLSNHYRSELTFNEPRLRESADAVARLGEACRTAHDVVEIPTWGLGDPLTPVVAERRDALLAALDADLDTPAALEQLDELATIALDRAAADRAREEAAGQIGELGGRVLGLRFGGHPTIRG